VSIVRGNSPVRNWRLSLIGCALIVVGSCPWAQEPTNRTAAGGGYPAVVEPRLAPLVSLPWSIPKDFPMPRFPADNRPSAEKFELGRHLFYDKRLSGNGKISCASCHRQALGFADSSPLSKGATGELTLRNSQHLANIAWNSTYTWANPTLTSVERQMSVPLFGEHPVEMGVNDRNRDAIVARVKADKRYQGFFRLAFPSQPDPFSWTNIIAAIATFQRGLITANSKFDQYQRGEAKLSDSELRGKDLFYGEKAECFHCHGGFNFSDQVNHAQSRHLSSPFHNTGLYSLDEKGSYPAPSNGLFDITERDEDMGKFRAPSLRNVEVSGPYMHDGSVASLGEVLEIYAAGGRNVMHGKFVGDGRKNPNKSELIGTIKLTKEEQADLVSFLKTLTDYQFLSDPRFSDPWRKTKH